jgi:uncharacterized membrane protein
MDFQRRKTSTAFEYFLYAAIIAETGLAALIYKVILSSHELIQLRVYFAVFYFAFLAWAIAQLNILHHNRNRAVADATPEPAQPEPEIAIENKRPLLGLTGPQLVIVVVVFATAVMTFSWALRLVL